MHKIIIIAGEVIFFKWALIKSHYYNIKNIEKIWSIILKTMHAFKSVTYQVLKIIGNFIHFEEIDNIFSSLLLLLRATILKQTVYSVNLRICFEDFQVILS